MIAIIRTLVEKLKFGDNSKVLAQSLLLTLGIYEKCFSFEHSAILLFDSMDEATVTNVPTSWRQLIADTPSTIQDLFCVLKADINCENCLKIKVLSS
jgi:hypothetical protein